jgi:hypothetical protein
MNTVSMWGNTSALREGSVSPPGVYAYTFNSLGSTMTCSFAMIAHTFGFPSNIPAGAVFSRMTVDVQATTETGSATLWTFITQNWKSNGCVKSALQSQNVFPGAWGSPATTKNLTTWGVANLANDVLTNTDFAVLAFVHNAADPPVVALAREISVRLYAEFSVTFTSVAPPTSAPGRTSPCR